jgi:hypothetical protein
VESYVSIGALLLVGLVLALSVYRARPVNPSRPVRPFWRVMDGAPVVVALIVAGVPLALFVSTQVLEGTDLLVGDAVVGKARAAVDDTRTRDVLEDCDDLRKSLLRINIVRVVPTESALDVELSLCVARLALRNIRVGYRQPFVLPARRMFDTRSARITANYPDAVFVLTLRGNRPRGMSTRRISARRIVGRFELDRESRLPTRVATVRLPLSGNARRYPVDEYGLLSYVSVYLPARAVMPQRFRGKDLVRSQLPLDIEVSANPVAGDFRWRSTMARDSFLDSITLSLDGRRSQRIKLFVGFLVLLPLLLFLAVLTVVPRPRPDDDTSAVGVLLGVAAFLLAMLPIRQFVVPQDVTSLTNVDFALGVEVAAMVASGIVLANGHRIAKRNS